MLDSANLLLHEAFHDLVNMETVEGCDARQLVSGADSDISTGASLRALWDTMMQHGKRVDVEEHRYSAWPEVFEMAKSRSKVRWCGWRREYVGIVDVRREVGIPICDGMRGEMGWGCNVWREMQVQACAMRMLLAVYTNVGRRHANRSGVAQNIPLSAAGESDIKLQKKKKQKGR
jgi:hypothetical protein